MYLRLHGSNARGSLLKLAKTSLLYGTALLLAYGIGHCAVIVVAGTSTELVQRYLNWNEHSRGVAVLKGVCGVLVIIGGIYLIYAAPPDKPPSPRRRYFHFVVLAKCIICIMREFMNITKALADENRVRMLLALRKGELCVCQITELFGLAASTVSKHLSILYQAGLVESRKEGRWIYYRAAGKGSAVAVREAMDWVEKSLAEDRASPRTPCTQENSEDGPRRTMQTPMPKMKVLFLCTGKSCRSQMAEGWARHLKGDVIEPYSAGIEKHGMNPHAVKVMAEAGVDISKHYSKTLEEIGPVQFDYVVTVCGHANEHCPVFPGKTKVVHVGFEDPPKLTKHLPDGEEKLAVYRRVRDEIRGSSRRCRSSHVNS